MLSRFALMVQAAVLDSQFFDLVPPFDDGGVAAKVGVDGRDNARETNDFGGRFEITERIFHPVRLNERLRKTLEFETPAERFSACVALTD